MAGDQTYRFDWILDIREKPGRCIVLYWTKTDNNSCIERQRFFLSEYKCTQDINTRCLKLSILINCINYSQRCNTIGYRKQRLYLFTLKWIVENDAYSDAHMIYQKTNASL